MKQVELHIRHSSMRMRAEEATYSYDLVFRKADGSVIIRSGQGKSVDTTRNSIVLDALLEALERFSQSVDLTVYTDNEYINNMLNRKMFLKWEQSGYLNRKGQKVADWQKWEKLNSVIKEHNVKALKE